MGNCIAQESQLQWGGEDWSSALAPNATENKNETTVLGGDGKGAEFRSKTRGVSCTEVKVKITKKQLEELMGKLDMQGVTVQQVLAQLVKMSVTYEAHRRTSTSSTLTWRPRLLSIPEISSFDSTG